MQNGALFCFQYEPGIIGGTLGKGTVPTADWKMLETKLWFDLLLKNDSRLLSWEFLGKEVTPCVSSFPASTLDVECSTLRFFKLDKLALLNFMFYNL